MAGTRGSRWPVCPCPARGRRDPFVLLVRSAEQRQCAACWKQATSYCEFCPLLLFWDCWPAQWLPAVPSWNGEPGELTELPPPGAGSGIERRSASEGLRLVFLFRLDGP